MAQANRTLAADLPDLIYQKRETRAPARPRVTTPPLTGSAAQKDSAPRKPKAALQTRQQVLSLDKLPGGCKRRPDSNKGSGDGRAFVPWCDK